MAAVNPLHYTFSLGGGGGGVQNALQELWHQIKEISATDIWPRKGLPLVLIWQTGADHLSAVFSCGVWGGCGCVVQFCYLGQDEVTQILQVCSWDQNEGCTPAIFAIQCFSSVLKKKPLVPLSQSWWVHWIGFQLDAWSEVCGYHRAEDIYTFCSTT